MNSIRNLKAAAALMPAWSLPLTLALGILGAFFFAQDSLADKPHPLVTAGTLYAVIGSLLLAALTVFQSIISAKPGMLKTSMEDGFIRGLNFVWSTSSVALVVYVCTVPVYSALTANISYTLTGAVAAVVLGVAYYFSKPRAEQEAVVDPISGLPATRAVALAPAGLVETQQQRPAFQVSMADLTRLMIHQAGRLIAYKGSNCVFEDSFTADLDVNARTAKIFTEMNLIATPEFLYWRLHMLMMGSAAEHALRNTTSEAALDDLANFDELASRFMLLSDGKNSFYRPANETEAAIKATRLGMLRKQIWSRCVSACVANKAVLLDMIRLLRGQHCLAYGDIKHLLDRVVMPPDFPVASFDSDEMMERALLKLSHDIEPEPALANEATPERQQPQQAKPQETAEVLNFATR